MEQRPDQPWLIAYQNPLRKRLGRDFFKGIPRTPGVYFMAGADGGVLYVGKAKDLRARVGSYARVRPDQVSRKVIRLLNLVREIRWEECMDETAALLRENQLLRDLRPPFNVVNTRPDTYYFIALKQLTPREARFRLTMDPQRQRDLLYGVFKGRARVKTAYAALLRMIWAAQNPPERSLSMFPPALIRINPPELYSLEMPEAWFRHLKRFLSGTSDRLLVEITEQLLSNVAIPRFSYRIIQDDLETLKEFYHSCPRRNRILRRRNGIKARVIAQDQIDDLLAREYGGVSSDNKS